MSINVELLRKTLEHITAHPEEHDQRYWACGTTMCLAGHAVHLAGYQIDWMSDSEGVGVRYANEVSTGELIEDVACQELGLSGEQAELLFATDRAIGQLWRLAHVYSDGQIEVPERFQPA